MAGLAITVVETRQFISANPLTKDETDHLAGDWLLFLLDIYAKSGKDNLTKGERNGLRKLVAQLEQ